MLKSDTESSRPVLHLQGFPCVGRVQVVLLLRFLGVSLITIMGLFQSSWSMPPLIVTLYLMRTGVNNSGYPIQKAILMDYVPKVQVRTRLPSLPMSSILMHEKSYLRLPSR